MESNQKFFRSRLLLSFSMQPSPQPKGKIGDMIFYFFDTSFLRGDYRGDNLYQRQAHV